MWVVARIKKIERRLVAMEIGMMISIESFQTNVILYTFCHPTMKTKKVYKILEWNRTLREQKNVIY